MAAARKQKQEELQDWQLATAATLTPHEEDSGRQQQILIQARQQPGFPVATGQMGHAIELRAERVMLDYSQAACSVRYQIDGQWEGFAPLTREVGDAMLVALKILCKLKPADRRSAQLGGCELKMGRDKYELTLQSQGVAGGERVIIRLAPLKIPFATLPDLGMRDTLVTAFREALNSESTSVMVSAPKGGGLTTSWNVSLNAADRLIRDFQALEDEDHQEPEIINVNPNFYGGSTGLTATALLQKMILKEPDVFVFPEVPDDDTLKIALDQTQKNQKQVIVRYSANSAIEACVRFCAQYPKSAPQFAATLAAVINQRMVRRLCEDCKSPFQPSPALLAKLGIPAGRVNQLFQRFVMPPIEQQVDENGKQALIEPCATCRTRGYHGRVGIYELLQPGPKFRDALLKTQDVALLTKIAQSEGFRGLQSEAILTVARGLTSLDELKRLFAAKS